MFDPEDPNGADLELLAWMAPLTDRLLTHYFALEVRGLSNIPDEPALVVGNHNSGAMFIEALGFAARVYVERPAEFGKWVGLTHDNIIGLPVVGHWLHRIGAIRASQSSAAKAFSLGHKVLVFPGGNREAFRPWSDRYQITLGNRRGFIRLALSQRVPIVPTVFVGGHSGFIVLRDNPGLATRLRAQRWLRSDTWPLILSLPWGISLGPLFHLPLPVGCITEVLPAIDTTPWADRQDHEQAVEDLFWHVQQTMQGRLDVLANERRHRAWPLRRR